VVRLVEMTSKVLSNAFNDYEYDKFQSLDLRVVVGGGLAGISALSGCIYPSF